MYAYQHKCKSNKLYTAVLFVQHSLVLSVKAQTFLANQVAVVVLYKYEIRASRKI